MLSNSYHYIRPHYSEVCFGILFLGIALWETWEGTVSTRGGRVLRSKQPVRFWGWVALHYLIGPCFVGHLLYVIYRNSTLDGY